MAITWGAFEGHMRVGIDVRHATIGASTTSVTVYADFYIGIDSTWDFGDNQRLNWGGSGGSGGWDYTNNLGPNQTLKIGTVTLANQGTSYNGGPTYKWDANVSGHYAGSTPSHSRSYTLPARPASVPNAPGLTVSNVTADAATFTIGVPSNNGDSIDDYDIQISTSSSFASVWATLDGNGTKTGHAAATKYYSRARAHNSVGYSAWSTTRSYTTGAEVPSAPTGLTVSNASITPTGATASWTAPSNDGGSDVLDYDVQFATNSGFTSGVQSFTGVDPTTLAVTTLLSGTPYWVRVRARNGVGYSAYTAAVTFTTLTGTPLIITPTEGASVTSGIASAVIEALGIVANARTITVEFSQVSSFASGILTATLTPASVASNNRYTVTDATKYLKTGTWYVRAKVTNTASGYVTPWSVTTTFTQDHTPSATVVSPSVGKTVQYSATTAFTWSFVDPAGANDDQTAYQLVVENNATGEVLYDSGKVVSTVRSIQVALANTLKNVTLRWRTRVWDKGDTVSAYTGYTVFTLSDPPVVSITTPGANEAVGSGSPTFSWTVSFPSGGTQTQAILSVFETDGNALVWSTTVTGTATSVTPPSVILRNLRSYYMTLKVTDSADLSTTATRNFTTSYNAPASIRYAVDAADVDEFGYVNVDWTEANPDDLFVMWKVYRRPPLGEWELVFTTTDQNTRSYKDYLVTSGASYTYSVTQVAMRSGLALESSVGYYLDDNSVETAENREFYIDLAYYWIINPDDPSMSVKLPNVTGDDTTLEFEDATYTIIGRGRHKDYGDELGYSGTITCQSREHGHPNIFRLRMELLRRAKETYYLRTPFGRLFPVALGNLSWTPLPGTGTSEMGDMSIPYEEVR